jgi:hypothetical protein
MALLRCWCDAAGERKDTMLHRVQLCDEPGRFLDAWQYATISAHETAGGASDAARAY